MGLLFYPRGGSAHVARNLAKALPHAGWDVTVLSGSLPPHGDAAGFYAGLDVRPVDMSGGSMPLHPSYEDRPGAADRVFACLDDAEAEQHVAAWARALQSAGAANADVLHLHHLTPLNEAAARVAPGVPIVGHLHGTELLMLEAIERDPRRWPHGEAWAERMRGWAAACERVIVLSESQIERAEPLLPVEPERYVVIPNGFDPETFFPRTVDRAAVWRRLLQDDAPGHEPVLLYVGRFTEVKRLPLLIEAYARARGGFRHRAPLVLVGGFPGEWEGEHPLDAIRRLGVEDVFLAGWHEHRELPEILAASAAIVLPSVREQFGQTLVEGMACGLPAIAVDAFGPADIVEHGETGWLVEPDDLAGLENALVEAVNRPAERLRRGAAARADVQERFAWPGLAERVANVYDATTLRHGAVPTP
jgi:glycosyltransferase involved in cell wall biosynthesis